MNEIRRFDADGFFPTRSGNSMCLYLSISYTVYKIKAIIIINPIEKQNKTKPTKREKKLHTFLPESHFKELSKELN